MESPSVTMVPRAGDTALTASTHHSVPGLKAPKADPVSSDPVSPAAVDRNEPGVSDCGGGKVWSSTGAPGAYTLTETWSPGRAWIGSGSVQTLAPGAMPTLGEPWIVARWFEPGVSAG